MVQQRRVDSTVGGDQLGCLDHDDAGDRKIAFQVGVVGIAEQYGGDGLAGVCGEVGQHRLRSDQRCDRFEHRGEATSGVDGVRHGGRVESDRVDGLLVHEQGAGAVDYLRRRCVRAGVRNGATVAEVGDEDRRVPGHTPADRQITNLTLRLVAPVLAFAEVPGRVECEESGVATQIHDLSDVEVGGLGGQSVEHLLDRRPRRVGVRRERRSSFGVVVVEGGDEVLHHRGGVGFLLPTDDTRRERHCQNDSSYRRNDIFSTTVVLSSGPMHVTLYFCHTSNKHGMPTNVSRLSYDGVIQLQRKTGFSAEKCPLPALQAKSCPHPR